MRRVRSDALLASLIAAVAGLAGASASACGSDGAGAGGADGGVAEGGALEGGAGPDGSVPVPTGDDDAGVPTVPPRTVDHACGGGLSITVVVLDDGTVRFHYVKDAAAADRGWLVDAARFAGPTRVDVSDGGGLLHVTTATLDVTVSGASCAIRIASLASPAVALWEEASPFAKDASGRVTLAKKLDAGEKIYGLGEKTGAAARRGRSFTMWNSDPAWSDPTGQYLPTSDPIYQSHPFWMSIASGGHASGAFLANTNQTGFDVGKTAPDALAMSASAGDVDLYFFDGPAPRDVLSRYTRLVGRAPMPPEWALGYHQSRWSYTPASRVEEVAFEFRRRGLPIDGLWLDIDYMDGFRDFTWNPSTFADPKGMLARLASNGFKVTTILDPGVKSDPGGSYAAYTDGVAKGIFIAGTDGAPAVRKCWPGDAVFPDFTSAKARTWWGDQLGTLLATGVRGTWIDMNEPAVFLKEGFPLDAKVDGDGTATTFGEIRNVYAWLMARATYEGQKKAFPDRRPFLLTRAGFAGIQRFAAVWTGDAQSTWDHLAMAPAMLQGLGVSGVPFVGSDIGGFTGSPSAELYGRWFELGSLSPFFRSHVATGTPDQEPWSFGPEVEDVAHRMLALRYALLPYWYAAYAETTRTGSPVLRPLWYAFPGDEEAFKHEDEVFVGPALLAAPVTAAGVTARAVYLPAGTFQDFYTGALYTGPTTVQMPAPLGRTPLFVRGGSVLQEQDVVDYVGAAPGANRYLDVYPGSPGTRATTDLYDDDGETMAYATGAVATNAVQVALADDGLTVTLGGRTGTYEPPHAAIAMRVHGVASPPTAVQIDGVALAESAFRYDAPARLLTVTLSDLRAPHVVVARYDAKAPPAPRQVSVMFDVTLPASTAAGDVFVASSAGGWLPAGTKLTRSGTRATGALTALEGTLVKYKVTRGAWPSVEVDGACASVANRAIVAAGGGATATIDVARWADACP
jgi:alpha-glucosidase